jgi:hypothetical protein
MKKSLILGVCALTLLSGCGSREEAEAKLARGCEAAAKSMLAKDSYDHQIDSIKGKTFGKSDGFTLVTITANTKNKEYEYENEESFQCKFEESTGPFGMNWKGALVQVKIGDDVYGSEGGELFGTVEDQMALTAAVEAAMH